MTEVTEPNQAFVDLMAAAGVTGRQLARMTETAGCGSAPIRENTISRWRCGRNAPSAAVVLLLRVLAVENRKTKEATP